MAVIRSGDRKGQTAVLNAMSRIGPIVTIRDIIPFPIYSPFYVLL